MDLKGHNYYQDKKGFDLLNPFLAINGQYALLVHLYKNNFILKFTMFNARITNVTMRRTFEGYRRVHNVPIFSTNYINIKITKLL